MNTLTLDEVGQLEQLGAVLERLPVGVIVFAKPRGEVTFVNTTARHMLSPERIRRGMPLPDPWPALSLPAYAQQLLGRGVTADERIDVEAGHVYAVSGMAGPGKEWGAILIEDVSGRERRLRAEREFVANAAHELLTPLTGLVGAAHVLEAGAKDVPEERDRFIKHIADECGRLTRIARSLLVLARAQSGEEPPRLDIFPLCQLVDEGIALMRHEGSASFTSECPDDAFVFVDADLFMQALVNLLTNAVRHGSGAEILIRVTERSGDRVTVEIVDRGTTEASGIASFRPRFRSGAGRDSGGFGLGLSIASQCLEVMGGRLVLDPGGGAVVRLELPSGRTE